jgi:hypothetical protein
MIRDLPQSLIATATKHLEEAVALKTHIAMAKKASRSTSVAGVSTAERISSHVIPSGQDTTIIPLERDSVSAHPQVVSHLNKSGYNVHDYKKGLAIKQGQTKNPISIGKVLDRTNAPQHVKEAYQKDPNRQGIDSSVHIVISRKPEHVAGMSTHQNWESCQTLGGAGKDENGNSLDKQDRGGEAQHVPEDIAAGSHVAYLVHNPEDVDKHYKPIARILLKPYTSESGHTILHPMKIYGEEWNGFHSSVKKWADTHFKATDPEYKMHDAVYPDGPTHIRSFAPEHDDHWAKKDPTRTSNWDILYQHPSSKVIDAWQDKIIPSADVDMYVGMLAKNPHLQDHHVKRMIDNPRIKESAKTSMIENHPAAVEYGFNRPEHHAQLVHNPHLKSSHIESMINTYKDQIENPPDDNNVRIKLGGIFNGLANHPNLEQHQADTLIKLDRAREYPGVMRGLYKKASAHHIVNLLNDEKETMNTNHWHYYDRAYASLMQHKPHLIKHMHPLMMYHGHNAVPRDQAESIEHVMLDNNPDHSPNFFHNSLSSRSLHPSVLNRIMNETSDENTKSKASGQLYRITHSGEY